MNLSDKLDKILENQEKILSLLEKEKQFDMFYDFGCPDTEITHDHNDIMEDTHPLNPPAISSQELLKNKQSWLNYL